MKKEQDRVCCWKKCNKKYFWVLAQCVSIHDCIVSLSLYILLSIYVHSKVFVTNKHIISFRFHLTYQANNILHTKSMPWLKQNEPKQMSFFTSIQMCSYCCHCCWCLDEINVNFSSIVCVARDFSLCGKKNQI